MNSQQNGKVGPNSPHNQFNSGIRQMNFSPEQTKNNFNKTHTSSHSRDDPIRLDIQKFQPNQIFEPPKSVNLTNQNSFNKVTAFNNGYAGLGNLGHDKVNYFAPKSVFNEQNEKINQGPLKVPHYPTYDVPNSIHSNREQRAGSFFLPSSPQQISDNQSDQIYRQQFLSLQEVKKNTGQRGPSRAEMLEKQIQNQDSIGIHGIVSQRRNNSIDQQLSQIPAGVMNYDKVVLSQEQMYGAQVNQQTLQMKNRGNSLTQNQQSESLGKIQNQRKVSVTQKNTIEKPNEIQQNVIRAQKKNIFSISQFVDDKLSFEAQNLLSGKLPSPVVPANPNNTYLFPSELRLALSNKNQKKYLLDEFKDDLAKNIQSQLEIHQSSGQITAKDGSEQTDRLLTEIASQMNISSKQNSNQQILNEDSRNPVDQTKIFKEVQIWSNFNQKPTIIDKINSQLKVKNKHFETIKSNHAHSRSIFDGQKSQIFENDANSLLKQPGSTQKNTLDYSTYDAIMNTNRTYLQEQDTQRLYAMTKLDTSQMTNQNTYAKNTDREAGQGDNTPQAFRSWLENSKIEQAPFQKTFDESAIKRHDEKQYSKRSPSTNQRSQISNLDYVKTMEAKQKMLKTKAFNELSQLHLYDSALLSKNIEQELLKMRLENRKIRRGGTSVSSGQVEALISIQTQHGYTSKKMSNELVNNFRQSMTDVVKNHNESRSPKNMKFLAPLKLNAQHLFKLNKKQIEEESEISSSIQSNINTFNIADGELQTMKGTKVNGLSPVTRNLNQLAMTTIKQAEELRIRQEIAKRMKQNLRFKMSAEQAGGDTRQILDQTTKDIKILRNDIKQIMAVEDELYHVLIPNNFEKIEILPELRPFHLKIACGGQKSPCMFEILMGQMDCLLIFMSTEHKFPAEENNLFQQEKLIIMDPELKNDFDQIQRAQAILDAKSKGAAKNQRQKLSSILIESSIKSKKIDYGSLLPKGSINPRSSLHEIEYQKLMLTKRTFKFHKPEFKEAFDENETLNITLLSQKGGIIQIRILFLNTLGLYGPEDKQVGKKSEDLKPTTPEGQRILKKNLQNEKIDSEYIVKDLNSWFNQNMYLLDNYKYMMKTGGRDFTEANKNQRLEKLNYKNLAIEHQKKLEENSYRRQQAMIKAQQNFEEKYQKDKQNLSKWEDYRETKIELTAIFIKVLKKKNFMRRWLITHKVGQTFSKIVENLYIRRALNHILYTSIHVAIRFKCAYKVTYFRRYGQSMDHRQKNIIRRALNFTALVKNQTIERDIYEYLGSFIFKSFLIRNTCEVFTYFNDNVNHIQALRRHMLDSRTFVFEYIYRRMEVFSLILGSFYAKKKSKKHGQKLIKAIKKCFGDRENIENFTQVRNQWELWTKRNMLESYTLLDAIHVRQLTITHQILALGTLKNEEGVKLNKEHVDNIKLKIDDIIKRIRKTNKAIEAQERDIFGISEKEIKDLNKQAKGRKPEPKVLALVELHKYDSNKIVKDDKLVKFVKAQYVKVLKNPKKTQKKSKKAGSKKDGKSIADSSTIGGELEFGADIEGPEGEIDGDGENEGENEGMDGDEAGENDGEAKEEEQKEGEGEAGDGNEEAAAEEAGEQKEGEGEAGGENEEAAADEAGEEKDEGGEVGETGGEKADGDSPSKKKAVSKSPAKKGKKKLGDDQVLALKLKQSVKVKNKWVLDEKLATPKEIMDIIEQKYPAQDDKKPVDFMTYQEVYDIVKQMYKIPQKQILQRQTESEKTKMSYTPLLKFMLHICLNIGPAAKLNEDIQENTEANTMMNTMITEVPQMVELPQVVGLPQVVELSQIVEAPEAEQIVKIKIEAPKKKSKPSHKSSNSISNKGSNHQCDREKKKSEQQQREKITKDKQVEEELKEDFDRVETEGFEDNH